MTEGMSHVATVGKRYGRIFLFAPYSGDVAAIDSSFVTSFYKEDLEALTEQQGVKGGKIVVLDHDSFCIRVRIPGADFDPNSKQHNASMDKLEALGELLVKRAAERTGR
jgi:hypothetical protein